MSVDSIKKINFEYVGVIADDTSDVAKAIREIMVQCDGDFVPPLSIREDATKNMSDQETHERDIEPYFQTILKQENLVAYCDDKIVAFMSFRSSEPYDCFSPTAKIDDKINYVSTICVLDGYRGHRITSGFYDIMEISDRLPIELPPDVIGTCVATRTWHTNDSHLGLLKKRGYILTKTIADDRRWNNEVFDTVYYCKSLSNHIIT
jgi:hypothetical protein